MTEDNDDLFPDDDGEKKSPKVVARDDYKKLERDLREIRKELDKERETRTALETEKRQVTLATTFEKAGLDTAWAKWYPADGEASEEKVKEWGLSEKLLRPTEEPGPVYQPTVSLGTPPNGSLMPYRDWENLNRQDPVAAIRALQQGRVDIPRSPYDTNRS